MLTAHQIMAELERMGSAQTKATFLRHGAVEPLFGVKVGDMKTIVKKVKANQSLAMELYRTGNSDAMYLAGLIAEPKKMSKDDLQDWVNSAPWHMVGEYTVPWVAAESPHGWELALLWIDSPEAKIAASGWATLASLVGIVPHERLDLPALGVLIERVVAQLHSSPNRVRYVMNTFLIAVGAGVPALAAKALKAASTIGKVKVDMGNTACKVPDAAPYIEKVIDSGRHGKKRKSARC